MSCLPVAARCIINPVPSTKTQAKFPNMKCDEVLSKSFFFFFPFVVLKPGLC